MNFEIIDNCFQVCVLLACAVFSERIVWKKSVRSAKFKASGNDEAALIYEKHARICLVIALGYTSFMLGTLFYVLHLALLSDITRIFYVSEVSWAAAYMFFISVELMREEGRKAQSRTPAVCIPVLICMVFYIFFIIDHKLPAPRVAFLVVLIALLTMLSVLAIRGIHRDRAAGRSAVLDILIILLSVLQISLYTVSVFIRDYTHFNLYFAVDITLTLTMVGICEALIRECLREEQEL